MKAQSGGIPRYRGWAGPAILEQGFRPFFLLAGLHAAGQDGGLSRSL